MLASLAVRSLEEVAQLLDGAVGCKEASARITFTYGN